MHSTKNYFVHICKLYSQPPSNSSFLTHLNNSKIWLVSQRNRFKGNYVGEEESEGANASTDEMVEPEQGENEASEMGEKAKKSTDKGMAYSQHLRPKTSLNDSDDYEEEDDDYDYDDEGDGRGSVERAWKAGKDTIFGDDSDKVDANQGCNYGDDGKVYEDEVVDEERMKRLAKSPGGKPIDENDVMHVYRRSLAENKS